jgi:cytochrome c oxidase subunit 2
MQQKSLLQITAVAALVLVASLAFLRQENASDPSLPEDVAQAVTMVEAKGCPACHTRDGSAGVGPTWKGSWGSVRQFGDGSSAVFDGAYLRQSVTDPAAKVVVGFQNLMLPVALSESEFQQLEVLLQYLAQPAPAVE